MIPWFRQTRENGIPVSGQIFALHLHKSKEESASEECFGKFLRCLASFGDFVSIIASQLCLQGEKLSADEPAAYQLMHVKFPSLHQR